ncbi:MAG: alpha/beta hydrolase, partial [Chthoniobacterales bacterium]|nr:alpha/beta hydrolase [Chthoniobacterales bacterium]
MTSFTKILLILAAVVLLLVASADSIFQRWREQRLQEIHSKSMILETYLGKVEFADKRPQAPEEIKNSANLSQTPTVVVLHGGAGGYDQGLAVGDWLVNHNIRVLAISRPGYLQTPLQSGLFPEQQADLLAAFADKLSLPKPSLIAVAEAAPVALLAAWRYPNFFDKIILFSPIAIRRGFSE